MQFPLIDSLPPEGQRRILAAARRRRFAKGEVIFHEGDPGESLHLVAKGMVAIRITTPLGDVAIVRVIREGEFFGELALLSSGPRNATASALEPVETLSLRRDHLTELRAVAPATADVLLTALTIEVRRLAAALVEALYLPAETRMWRRLLELTELYARGAPTNLVPLTQEELAQLAGITRPTANRALRKAEGAGALALARGRIEIMDIEWVKKRAR